MTCTNNMWSDFFIGWIQETTTRWSTAAWQCGTVKMVPKGGLEPPWVAPHAPQTCVSTSSTTSARVTTLATEVTESTEKNKNLQFSLTVSSVCSVAKILLFHRRLLSIYGGEPVRVSAVPPVDDVEKCGLQFLGHGPRLARPDGPVVHFADRRYLGRSAGEERLVGNVKLVSREPFLHEAHSSLGGQLHDRVALDALQDGSK